MNQRALISCKSAEEGRMFYERLYINLSKEGYLSRIWNFRIRLADLQLYGRKEFVLYGGKEMVEMMERGIEK